MEMCYFWLLDQETQRYFKFYYHPGQENMGNFPSIHHTPKICIHTRPYYLHTDMSPRQLLCAVKPSSRRGCAETLEDLYMKQIPLPRIPHSRDLLPCTYKSSSVQPSNTERTYGLAAAQLKARTQLNNGYTKIKLQ